MFALSFHSGFKSPDETVVMDDDSEDMIGPRPHTGDQSEDAGSVAADIERRAQLMKEKLDNPVKIPKLQVGTRPHHFSKQFHSFLSNLV